MSRQDAYNTIVEAGFNIGGWDEFNEAMDDERRIKKLWEKIHKDAPIGNYDEFRSSVKKKAGSAAAESYYGISGGDEAEDSPGYDVYHQRMANYQNKKQEVGEDNIQSYYQSAEGMQFLSDQEKLKEQEEQLGFKVSSTCPIGMVWDASRQKCVDADWWYENLSTEDQEKNSELYYQAIDDQGSGEYENYKDKRDLYLGRRDLRKTPFKNQEEGNDFRKWVVENYPEWAEVNNLTATGKEGYDNSYVRKAYEVFGKYYEARLKDDEYYMGESENYRWDGANTGMKRQEFYDYQLATEGPYRHDGANTGISEAEWKDKNNPASQYNIKRKIQFLPWDELVNRFDPDNNIPESEPIYKTRKEGGGFMATNRAKEVKYIAGWTKGREGQLQDLYTERHAVDFEKNLDSVFGKDKAYFIKEQIDAKIFENGWISEGDLLKILAPHFEHKDVLSYEKGEYIEPGLEDYKKSVDEKEGLEDGVKSTSLSAEQVKSQLKKEGLSGKEIDETLKKMGLSDKSKNQSTSKGDAYNKQISAEQKEKLLNEVKYYLNWKSENYLDYKAYEDEQKNIENVAKMLQSELGVDELVERGRGEEKNLTQYAYEQKQTPEGYEYYETYKAKIKNIYGKMESYDKAYSIINDNISDYGSIYMNSYQQSKRLMFKGIEDAIEAGASDAEIALLRENYDRAFSQTKGKRLFNPFTGEAINQQELSSLPDYQKDYIQKIQFKTETQSEALKSSMYFNPTGNMQKDLQNKRMRAYYKLIESAQQIIHNVYKEGYATSTLDAMIGADEGWENLFKAAENELIFNPHGLGVAGSDYEANKGKAISSYLTPLGYHSESQKLFGYELDHHSSHLQIKLIEQFNESLSDFIALNNVLDLNLDPGGMDRTGAFDRGVAALVDAFEPEGYDTFTLADDFVQDATKNIQEMGYEITDQQEERLKLRFVDKLGDAIGGSIPVMVEIMAVSYFTGGMGLTSSGSKVGKVQKFFNRVLGDNKAAKIFGSMAEQGLIFAPTSEDFSTGAGEGAGFALYDMTGLDNLIKKSPLGRVVNTILKAMSGATAETVQEYAGEFVNRLSTDPTVGDAFKNTFISEDPLEKLAITYTMSAMFGVASLRGDWKQTKLDMEEAILKSKSDSQLVEEVKASIIKERQKTKKQNEDNLINTPDNELTGDEIKEKNEIVNNRQVEKEEFVKDMPSELKQELGSAINLNVESNPDGALFEYDDSYETTYEINGRQVSEEEILNSLSNPSFLSDMANPNTETSVKINNGTDQVNQALDLALASVQELSPVISKAQQAQENSILADKEGSEPGVVANEDAGLAVDEEGNLVASEDQPSAAPKLSKGDVNKKKYSKDHTPREDEKDYDLNTSEGRSEAVDDILDDINDDLDDLEIGSTEKTNTKEDDALLDEFNEIEKSISSDVFIDNSTGEKIIYNDPDSDAFNDIEFFDDASEGRNIIDDIGLASPYGTTPTLSKEQEADIKNAPFYGKTLIEPLMGQDGSVIIPAGTKIGLKEAQQLIVENKKDFESSSQMDLISQVAYSNNPNIVKDVSETKKEDVERLIELRDRIKSRKKISGKTAAKKVAPFKSTSEEALEKIDSKKISSEDAATEWAKQIINKGEKGTTQELEAMGVIEPVSNLVTEQYAEVLEEIKEHKKYVPYEGLEEKTAAKWEETLNRLEKRRDDLKSRLPKEKFVATEKFRKAVSKEGSNAVNKADVEKFLKDNSIIIEEATTEKAPSFEPIPAKNAEKAFVKVEHVGDVSFGVIGSSEPGGVDIASDKSKAKVTIKTNEGDIDVFLVRDDNNNWVHEHNHTSHDNFIHDQILDSFANQSDLRSGTADALNSMKDKLILEGEGLVFNDNVVNDIISEMKKGKKLSNVIEKRNKELAEKEQKRDSFLEKLEFLNEKEAEINKLSGRDVRSGALRSILNSVVSMFSAESAPKSTSFRDQQKWVFKKKGEMLDNLFNANKDIESFKKKNKLILAFSVLGIKTKKDYNKFLGLVAVNKFNENVILGATPSRADKRAPYQKSEDYKNYSIPGGSNYQTFVLYTTPDVEISEGLEATSEGLTPEQQLKMDELTAEENILSSKRNEKLRKANEKRFEVFHKAKDEVFLDEEVIIKLEEMVFEDVSESQNSLAYAKNALIDFLPKGEALTIDNFRTAYKALVDSINPGTGNPVWCYQKNIDSAYDQVRQFPLLEAAVYIKNALNKEKNKPYANIENSTGSYSSPDLTHEFMSDDIILYPPKIALYAATGKDGEIVNSYDSESEMMDDLAEKGFAGEDGSLVADATQPNMSIGGLVEMLWANKNKKNIKENKEFYEADSDAEVAYYLLEDKRDEIRKLDAGKTTSKRLIDKLQNYSDSHDFYGENTNVLSWGRTKDVDIEIDGKPEKVLMINEIQSDWSQQGRKKGVIKKGVTKKESSDIENKLNRLADEWTEIINNDPAINSLEADFYETTGERPNDINEYSPMSMQVLFEDYKAKRNERLNELELENKELAEEYRKASEEQLETASEGWAEHGLRRGPATSMAFMDTQSWTALQLRRLLKVAVDRGYDRIALPRGEQAGKAVGARQEQMAGNQKFYNNMVPNILKKEARRLDKKASLKTVNLSSVENHVSKKSTEELSKMQNLGVDDQVESARIDAELEYRSFQESISEVNKELGRVRDNSKLSKARKQSEINRLLRDLKNLEAQRDEAAVDARSQDLNEQITLEITPKMKEALSDPSPSETKKLPKFSKGDKKKASPTINEINSTRDAIQKQKTESGLLRSEQSEMGLQEVGQRDQGAKSKSSSVSSEIEKPTIATKNDSKQLDADIKAEKNPEKRKVLENVKKVNTALGKVDSEMKIVVHKSEESYASAYEGAGGVKGDAMGTRGFFNNGKEIHINLNEATSETAFHEGAHKVIAAVLVNNPELLNKFNKQLRSILPARLVKKYDEKVESYDKSEQTEEFIVNILADVADGTLDLNTLPKTALSRLVDLFNKLLVKFGFDPRFTVSNIGDVVEFAEKMKNAFTEGVELDVSALTQDTAMEVKDIPDKLKSEPKKSKKQESNKDKLKRIISKFNKAKEWMKSAKENKKPEGELELLTNEEIKFAKDKGAITDQEINNLEKEMNDYLDKAPPEDVGGKRAGGIFGGLRSRKFHKRVSKASWVPNKVKNILEKAFYEPITNEELREFSKGVVDSIEHKGINEGDHSELTIGDKFQSELEQLKNDPLVDEAMLVAIAMDMVERLNSIATSTGSDAVSKQEANIIDFISERGTKMGQAIQAFKIFGSSSVHGLMSYAKKQLVDKGGITEEQFEREMPELKRLIDRIKNSPEGFQKANATFDFMSKIANTNGINKRKIAMAIWYANILSGYTTQGVNFVSTAFNGILNLGSVLAYRPMMVPRYLTHVLGGAVSPISGMKKGIAEFRSILSTGSKKSDKFDMPNELEMKEFRGIFKIFSKHKFVGRFMQATDAFFYETFKEQKAYMLAVDVAREKGLKGRALAEEVSNILYGTKETQEKIHKQAAKELNIELDKKGNPKPITRKKAEEIARDEGYGITREQAEEIAKERGYTNEPIEVDGKIIEPTSAMKKAFNQEVETLLRNRGEKAFNERVKKIEERSTKLQYKRRVMELLEKNRPEGFADETHNFASTGTYNYKPKGLLGIVAEGIGDITRKAPILRFIYPFTRIVANVTNESLEYTPYGFKRAAFGMKGEKATREARAQHLTKALFGTALMVGFAMKAWDDEEEWFDITGAGPKDRQKYYDLLATGWRPYSLKVGDKYFSYKYTPLNVTLGAIGTWRDRVLYEEDDPEKWGLIQSLLFNTGANIMDQSFLSSGARVMEALGRGEESAKQMLGVILRPAKSFVIPNLYTQLERAADPTLYESKSLLEYAISHTPAIIHQNLPKGYKLRPALNIFGEEIQKTVNPFFSTKDKDVDKEFKWLVDNKYWLSVPNSVQWYNGETTENVLGYTAMTNEQRWEWIKKHGPKVKEYVRGWMNMSEEDINRLKESGVDIHKEIKSSVNMIREQVKTEMEWEEVFGEEYKNIENKSLTYLNNNDVYYDRPDRMKEILTPDGDKRLMTTEEYENYWQEVHKMSRFYVHEWFRKNTPEQYKEETGEVAHEYLRSRLTKIEKYYQDQKEMESVLGKYDKDNNPSGYLSVNDIMKNKDGDDKMWNYSFKNKDGKNEVISLNTEEYLMLNDVFLDSPTNSRTWLLSDYVFLDDYNVKNTKVSLSPETYKIYLQHYQEAINELMFDLDNTIDYTDEDHPFSEEWKTDKGRVWSNSWKLDFIDEYIRNVDPKKWSNIP